MNNETAQRPSAFGGFVARIVAGAMRQVEPSPATNETRFGRRIRITANEVFENPDVQAEAERITNSEVNEARAQIPAAFELAEEGLVDRPEVVDSYRYIRESMKTQHETIFQRLYRPVVARLLSIGAGISSLLTVKYAERWYTGDFTDEQTEQYKKTMKGWFAIWLGQMVKKNESTPAQAINPPSTQPAARQNGSGALATGKQAVPAAA